MPVKNSLPSASSPMPSDDSLSAQSALSARNMDLPVMRLVVMDPNAVGMIPDESGFRAEVAQDPNSIFNARTQGRKDKAAALSGEEIGSLTLPAVNIMAMSISSPTAEMVVSTIGSEIGNPYWFTGRRVDVLDNGAKLVQINRHRYYDYETGRWLSVDPLGVVPGDYENPFRPVGQYADGGNLWEYVDDNPIITNDPLGLKRVIALLNGQNLFGWTKVYTLTDRLKGEPWNTNPDNIREYFEEDADWNYQNAAGWIRKTAQCNGTICCHKIIIVGHSNGGDGARKVAAKLRPYPVDLLFLFDPIGKPWHPGPGAMVSVSGNVLKSIGVRQNVDTTLGWNILGLFGFKMQGYSIPGMLPSGDPWAGLPNRSNSAHGDIIDQFKSNLANAINAVPSN